LVLLLLFITAFGVMDYLVNKAFDSYRVDPKITTVFMGDSHPQCAVNDAFLPNARNFAQAAEASYYTYFKMKTLLENNPSIKKSTSAWAITTSRPITTSTYTGPCQGYCGTVFFHFAVTGQTHCFGQKPNRRRGIA
jgi:hypothetical protein